MKNSKKILHYFRLEKMRFCLYLARKATLFLGEKKWIGCIWFWLDYLKFPGRQGSKSRRRARLKPGG